MPGALTEILDVTDPPGFQVYVYGGFPPVTVVVKANDPEPAEHNTGVVGLIVNVNAEEIYTL